MRQSQKSLVSGARSRSISSPIGGAVRSPPKGSSPARNKNDKEREIMDASEAQEKNFAILKQGMYDKH